MEKLPTALDGPLLLRSAVHRDERGFFSETFRASELAEHGVELDWVQDNHSRSRRGVVRGLHFQLGEGQAKLLQCVRGEVFDVLVDLRRGSPTYGRWEGYALNDADGVRLFAPVGFAHGFCAVSDAADVLYKCSSYYDPGLERTIAYNDPDVGIEWPDFELTVSERDGRAPRLAEIADELPFEY
jgi:dTDP-4-dehydrorhamnose 3,5-epimerase